MATTNVVGSPGEVSPSLPVSTTMMMLSLSALLVCCAVYAVEWAWWRPRRQGRVLRSQGVGGTTYCSLAGDAPLSERLERVARSRPLPLGCHDVVPRAMPLFYQTVKQHGKTSITWFGPVPRVTITKPQLVREVLSNKLGHFGKLKLGRLQRRLHNGVGSHEGEKWAKHRRIINPAFHQEKLKNALRTGKAACDDLLGLLLESNMEHCKGNGGDSGTGITTDDLIGECKLFYVAGMETTSVLLTWTMVVLCMHPEWQERARDEVIHAFGDRTPEYDGLSRLRIVTMVLYEVLRLYTPLTALHRRTETSTELGGVRYPAGVVLTLPLLCVHHDKDVWGPDADEFRPERFAEGVFRASRDAPAFFPFGWGPRTCLAQNFALLEAKMGISMILQRFVIELSPAYSHAPVSVGLLKPEHGAQVRLKRLPRAS
ncbi:hypothetical protein HU200_060016 [Digitaria exilis]|uniref:Cytochrome P450 n=1 Tax=Digitaria exilis TaxID=1010633 RepID=A0A835A9Z8_9POAL|nr:hypothetical protein HU200_060016 [Digitaria exilis]